MGEQGAIATEVPWPSHYDVKDVPPADFTPAALPGQWEGLFNNAEEDGIQLPLYWEDGKSVQGVDRFGGSQSHSYWYVSSGRRKQMYWEDGSPASSYWPDGTQIPLYDPFGEDVTDGVPDPLWTPPEPEVPEEPEPEEPEEPEVPEEPAAPLVSKERLQAFTPDDALTDDVAALAVEAATALVEAYTRGRHLDGGGKPRPGITTVILTAAARIGANPGQVSRQDQAGSFSSRRGVGFSGFTLAELAVLNRYRKRATG